MVAPVSVRSLVTLFALAAALVAAVPPARAEGGTKLLRFPDLHGDRVVFVYGGDLWTASAQGGRAARLTAHPGMELFPKFSPDGEWIAFTGQYDGDEQVYVMPARGGEPRQLTFYPALGPLPPRWGYDNQVYDWTADGKALLVRSARESFDLGDPKLFLVPVDGGMPRALPMPEAGAGDLSPDGKRVVYSPLFRDFRTWKRYQGGWAQELYIFELDGYGLTRITDHPRSDRDPMWVGDAIVFNSDRTGTLNLYRYTPADGRTEALTEETVWDVRWPSDDGTGRIVYELDGGLRVLDLATGGSRALTIDVPDDGLARRATRVSAAGDIEDFELSPGGERALFVARGDVFTAPIEDGPTRNLTRTPGAHEKHARWSPDGRTIAYIGDASGEEEIWLVAQDGDGAPRQLTDGGRAMRYAPEWSPDGTRLAFSDKDGKLYVVEVEGGAIREIADDRFGRIFDYVWSPCGGHLAYSMSDPNGTTNSIEIWTAADGSKQRLGSDLWNEFNPAWDPEGNYLFYLSDRMFQPQIGSVEWNYVVDRETGIYAAALRKDVPHPFPPESDEVKIDGADGADGDDDGEEDDDAASVKTAKSGKGGKAKSKGGKDGDAAPAKKEPIRIDREGLSDRVARVPVEEDNYGGLSAVKGHLVYVRGTAFYYGRRPALDPEIRIFSMEEREASTLAENAGGYALSADGKKLLAAGRGRYALYEVKPKAGKPEDVSTAGLVVDRVPAEEWPEIFREVWRRFRDFFYVENMHGYDWESLRAKYEPLLAHVAHRSDLNYVLGEMIAELNVSHAYISGGDYEIPDRAPVALPGATFVADEAVGLYRLGEIFPGQNEEPRYRSPLREIGIDAREGDYVLAIDGEPLTTADNPYRRLRHRADRPVELTLNDRPTAEGAREVSYTPVTDEDPLRYLRMVERNRARVDALSGGRVGYLHIPDMGANGIREFIKHFYGQIRKEGLVVDVRGNGGGNVSQMIIERLDRELLGTRFGRLSDEPATYPAVVFHGHMACVLDEDSASDGDIFPYRFREAGLGPLIGKRSWGGVVGISGHGPLLDGGDVRVPQSGTNAVDGSWVIEGHGVDPDIEVDNDPASVLAGEDPQLERAVAEVLAAIERDPKRLPSRPPDPVKTR